MPSKRRATGAFLGLACGDALGRPVEFQSPQQIEAEHGELTEMLGYGTHGQSAGTITDDTEMALCIARSLAERDDFDGPDVAGRFVDWYKSGPFDIGLMTRDVLQRIRNGAPWDEAGYEVWEDRPEGSNAGNGSVMRCVPHAIAFRDDREKLTAVSRESSAITHADPRCRDACAVLNHVVAALVMGRDSPVECALECLDEDCDEAVHEAASTATEVRPSTLSNTGYVVDTLQSGLHSGLTASSAERAIVNAVNRGGDTDTHGAVAGAVAGARFGAGALPDRWLEVLAHHAEIESLAKELL